MSPLTSDFSRLFLLINDLLHPFTESETLSVNKEKEKNLLLLLSQVSNEIHRLVHATNASSLLSPDLENHQFLSKAISDLLILLTLNSRFVQHLAGSLLVNLSELLASLGESWELLVRSLCICFAISISNICSFEPSFIEVEGSDSEILSLLVFLKPKLNNASMFSVAGVTQILRNILKFLREECDDEISQLFLNLVHVFILKLPWDSMEEVFGGNGCGGGEQRVVFLGNFIQFLCSLVELFSFVEAFDGSVDKHVFLSRIVDLVPKLLYWCLGKIGEDVKVCTSQYFKHKLLVLMIRLSFQIPLDSVVLVSWLQLLHDYFQELLCQPLTGVENQDDCLEDSPFLSSISDGEVHSMHCHLQRQAVFLFLRCSFCLINPRKDTSMDCSSATSKSDLGLDTMSNLSCHGRKKGLLELYTWLSDHLHVDLLADHETYLEKCRSFSFSFLKLYMHEDDVLFKLLLQLVSVPACEEQQFPEERWASLDVPEDVVFHVSNVFNPIHLFHLFLAELHYDHQVLLDYLISKDTGTSCAEYLLRCLPMICDSWEIFTDFSLLVEAKNQSYNKRRKVVSESYNFEIEPSSGPVLVTEKNFKGNIEYGTGKQAYEQAKDCLISLKISMENLQQKNLFPYNPEALLKRLTRFQKLCFEQ